MLNFTSFEKFTLRDEYNFSDKTPWSPQIVWPYACGPNTPYYVNI